MPLMIEIRDQIERSERSFRKPARYFLERAGDGLRRILRRRRDLEDFDSPVANEHAIREGSAGVDGDAQFAPASIFSWAPESR